MTEHRDAFLDYELDDVVYADSDVMLKALANGTRTQILDLVLERSATVTELAAALGRPKSSIAHHVDTLVQAGLLKVVRTRKVRAIEERFYGRTGRTIVMGANAMSDVASTLKANFISQAHDEAAAAGWEVLATLRHARIPADRAAEFFDLVGELAERFTRLERGGDTVYGFVGAVFETTHPTLPPAQ
jgi:DNA-binding transcriptional ArsR family regulator